VDTDDLPAAPRELSLKFPQMPLPAPPDHGMTVSRCLGPVCAGMPLSDTYTRRTPTA
jgi:hypothetical protein